MVKMIFSDFDGTMLDYYSEKNFFTDYQLDILDKVHDVGCQFCIVTGRSISFFEQFPKLLQVIDYIIGSNGACIYDVKNARFIYQKFIHRKSLQDIIGISLKNQYSFLLNCLDKRYQYGNWDHLDYERYQEGKEYSCEQIVISIPKRDIKKNSVEMEKVSDILFNNIADWDSVYSIDINDRSVSKGNGIQWICDYLNISLDDTIAFGDSNNDLSMFQVVGKSMAMGNACEEVKVMADEVVDCCLEDGIYRYIEKKLLK